MKDPTRYNLKEQTPADPFAGRQIAQKRYEQLAIGDRVWWSGQVVQLTEALNARGSVALRFAGEFVTGPLKGARCFVSGLAYGHISVENEVKA